jgi:hypothetical protein
LKALEAVQFFLDPPLQLLARPLGGSADPIPFPQQQFPVLPIGLEIECGRDGVANQNRQREITEAPLRLRHIGFEKVFVAEDQVRPLPLNDQGIERGKNVNAFGGLSRGLQRLRPRPMLLFAGAMGTSSLRRRRASINRRTAFLLGASR